MRRLHNDRDGEAMIEYVLITAIITVGIVTIFAPSPDGGAFGFYDTLRSIYRRELVIISVPLL